MFKRRIGGQNASTLNDSSSLSNVIEAYIYHAMFDATPDDVSNILMTSRVNGRWRFRRDLALLLKRDTGYCNIDKIREAMRHLRNEKHFRSLMFDFGINARGVGYIDAMFSKDFMLVVASLLENQAIVRAKLLLDQRRHDGIIFYLRDNKGNVSRFAFDMDRDSNKVINLHIPEFTKLIYFITSIKG